MIVAGIDLLWPYGGPDSARPIDQMDVVVEMKDGSRWISAFYDTHRFNQGVKSFRGLGPEQPFRFGPRMVIVQELTESTVQQAIDSLLEAGNFEDAFEQL